MNRRIALLFFVLAPPVVAFAAMWQLWLTPGTIGHNWDQGTAPLNFYLLDALKTMFHSWWDFRLGEPRSGLYVDLPVWLMHLPALLGATGHFISKGVVWAMLAGNIYSMGLLVCWLLDRSPEAFGADRGRNVWIGLAAGIAYSLAPPVFGNVIGGSVVQYWTLPILPLIVLSGLMSFDGRKLGPSHICLAILLAASIPSTQNFLICCGLLLLLVFLSFTARNVVNLIVVLALCIVLDLYGLLSIPAASDSIAKAAAAVDLASATQGLYSQSSAFFKTLLICGYWGRDFFLNAHPFPPLFFLSAALLLAGIVGAWLFKRQDTPWGRYELLFGLLWLVFVAIAGLGHSPVWPVLKVLFENITAMQIFRSSQRLLTPLNLTFAIVLGMSLGRLCNRFPKLGRVLVFGALALILVRAAPFWEGAFGAERLELAQVGTMANYRVPPPLARALVENNYDLRLGRTIFLPASSSPYYLANEYQSSGQGVDPIISFAPGGSVSVHEAHPSFLPWRSQLHDFYTQLRPESVLDMARMFNAKSVILRTDIEHHYYDLSLKSAWVNHRREYGDALRRLPGLTRRQDDAVAAYYTTDDFVPMLRPLWGKPRIWYSGEVPAPMDLKGYDHLRSPQFTIPDREMVERAVRYLDGSGPSDAPPSIEFARISATRYVVRVHDLNRPFTFLFNQSFHRGWKLYLVRRGAPGWGRDGREDGLLEKYAVLRGNASWQAPRSLVGTYLEEGKVTSLGDGAPRQRRLYRVDENGFDRWDGVERYDVRFISREFHHSIQNDNLAGELSASIDDSAVFAPVPAGDDRGDLRWEPLPDNRAAYVRWPDELHWITNGFANGWWIDPELMRRLPRMSADSAGYWFTGERGGMEFELVLEFTPHHVVRTGLIISLSALALSLIVLAMFCLRRLSLFGSRRFGGSGLS